MTDFKRSITFEIPGSKKSPAVDVTVVEVEGALEFVVTVQSTKNLTADLRGLFFDFNSVEKLAGLAYEGSDVTGFETLSVIDMGNGANMQGAASPFDVGLAFGTAGIGHDSVHSTIFTLSNDTCDLTLDDIANVQFGARTTSQGGKLVVTAPAAPDAVDDAYTMFEDGQAGLSFPSSSSFGQIFEVLSNDTDADGDALTITAIKGAEHGTVRIVDGADADTIAGDAILYTPHEDYSGSDSFMYSVSDNNGGTDFATTNVLVTAVADVPALTYEVLDGPETNQLIMRVTATQTDADGSEFIDNIALSGMPFSVYADAAIYDPADQPDRIVKDFLLTLPAGQDTNFDLGITAVSKEESNGDTESASVTVPVRLDYNANAYDLTFVAEDQSIWSTGSEAKFTDDRFIGIDKSWDESGGWAFFYGGSSGHLKSGFQSTLELTAGGIDASVPYDISVETNYNKTTDVLQISSSAAISNGAYFSTEGPGGSYNLDFIFDFYLNAYGGLDLWDYYEIINFSLGPSENEYNILNIDSSDLSYEVPLDFGLSLEFSWPDISTISNPSAGNVFASEGESNNFFQVTVDVDDLIFAVASAIAGVEIPNPFDQYGFDWGFLWASVELLDVDLWAGLNFAQDFTMTVEGLPGIITYEDGTSSVFTFGQDIVLADASTYDQNLDGEIDFSVALDPDVLLNNDTDLGLNLGYLFKVLEVSGGYDVWIDSDSFAWTAYSTTDNTTIPLIGVYDETFDLNFASQEIGFTA